MKTAIIAATISLGAFAVSIHDVQAWTQMNQRNTQSVQINPAPVFNQYRIPEHVRTPTRARAGKPWYSKPASSTINCRTTSYGNTSNTSCR